MERQDSRPNVRQFFPRSSGSPRPHGPTNWPEGLPIGEALTLPDRTILTLEGQPIGAVYLVEAGVVSLSRQTQGLDMLLGYRAAGAAPGVCCAASADAYGVTTRAVGAVRVRPVPVATYRAAWEWLAPVREWALHVLANEIDAHVRMSAALGAGTAEGRLAGVLAELFRTGSHPTPTGERRLVLPDTIEHLATSLRVSREHLSRALTKLVRAGVVRRDGRRCLVAPAESSLGGLAQHRVEHVDDADAEGVGGHPDE